MPLCGASGGLLFCAPFLLPLHEIGKLGGAREIELPSVGSNRFAEPRPDGIAGAGIGGSYFSLIWSQSLAAAQFGRENCFVFSCQSSHKQRPPAACPGQSAPYP